MKSSPQVPRQADPAVSPKATRCDWFCQWIKSKMTDIPSFIKAFIINRTYSDVKQQLDFLFSRSLAPETVSQYIIPASAAKELLAV
ncbi:MAG: hypothetical protein SWH68_05190 [Thermodesulfobacteriota bacterium]|nr:hypothetical protein [Thermodesulfobacteriota bacterium]